MHEDEDLVTLEEYLESKTEQEYYGLNALKEYVLSEEFDEAMYSAFMSSQNSEVYEKVSEEDFDECFYEHIDEMKKTVLQGLNRAALHSCFSSY